MYIHYNYFKKPNPMNETNMEPEIDKITPVGATVLVNIYKKPTKTASGLDIPETESTGTPIMGQIIAVGKRPWYKRSPYTIGQWVMFRKYSIDEMKMTNVQGDFTVFLLEEAEIRGIVN